MNGAAIQLSGVNFAYGPRRVLQGIDLAVGTGEIVGLVGADGAGKSTLLRIALGQLEPQAGEVRVLGRAPHEPGLRAAIAYMPQGFGLYQDLSVAENLIFFADLHGLAPTAAAARIGGLLQRTGLTGFEGRRAGQLSGGMMQKLALACALVTEPGVMFLDEPTTGVDPVSRRAFWRLLDGVRAEGMAILYATANMDEAERCDRVAILEAGAIRRSGAPETLVDRAGLALVAIHGPQVRRHRGALRRAPEVKLLFPVGPRLNVWVEEGDEGALAERLAAQFSGLRCEPLQPTLHDAALRDLALALAEVGGG